MTKPQESPPEGLTESHLLTSLAEWLGTGLQAEFLRVGGASYHWRVADGDGQRYFVTVDDLDQKGFLGPGRDSAFNGLHRALSTAYALRHQAGLEFVVAPLPAAKAVIVRRIDSRYAVAVYPYIEDESDVFGEPLAGNGRTLIHMLVRLHQADPAVAPRARQLSVALTGRSDLERALGELEVRWTGGPFSEPARALLTKRATDVRRLLERFDQIAGKIEAARKVITHGDANARNVIRGGNQPLLVDWDTVGLAPPERDLWMVDAGAGEELRLYSEASGRAVDAAAIDLYTIRWVLDGLSLSVRELRAPHRPTMHTGKAWRELVKSMAREWPTRESRVSGGGMSGFAPHREPS